MKRAVDKNGYFNTCVQILTLWLLVFTTRVENTREGTVFTGSVCPHFLGVPHPRCRREGGTLSQVLAGGGGVPHPADGRGIPYPRSRWRGTIQQLIEGGYPIPGPGGGWYYPLQLMGVPHPRSRQGVPYPAVGGGGYPVPKTGWGTPPPPRVRRQSSIASTCYVVVGMPLAFTQEDFLVKAMFTPAAADVRCQ